MGIQPVSAVGREDQDQTEGRYNDLLAQSLRKQEESRTTLTEMIRDAILEKAAVKNVLLLDTAGVSTMYANDGGIILVM